MIPGVPRPLDYYTPPKKSPLINRERPTLLGGIALFFALASFPCCYSLAYTVSSSDMAGLMFAGIGQTIALTASLISIRTTAGKLGLCLVLLSMMMSLAFFFQGQ
jgi:hypothetical protein